MTEEAGDDQVELERVVKSIEANPLVGNQQDWREKATGYRLIPRVGGSTHCRLSFSAVCRRQAHRIAAARRPHRPA